MVSSTKLDKDEFGKCIDILLESFKFTFSKEMGRITNPLVLVNHGKDNKENT